jgi:predicted PurR-regulated permease PerM
MWNNMNIRRSSNNLINANNNPNNNPSNNPSNNPNNNPYNNPNPNNNQLLNQPLVNNGLSSINKSIQEEYSNYPYILLGALIIILIILVIYYYCRKSSRGYGNFDDDNQDEGAQVVYIR